MGCFSFLCKESGKPALSTSYNGSPCYLFLLKDGKVIEEMYGNYNSYGAVFDFEWNMDWGDVCDLMFHNDRSNGIAMILADNYNGEHPTTRSEDDPNQGWGDDGELLGDVSSDGFDCVINPYHKVY